MRRDQMEELYEVLYSNARNAVEGNDVPIEKQASAFNSMVGAYIKLCEYEERRIDQIGSEDKFKLILSAVEDEDFTPVEIEMLGDAIAKRQEKIDAFK